MRPEDYEWTNLFEFNPEEMEELKTKSQTFLLPSTGLKFMDDHFGLRPGCFHTLMGSSGAGKSTLIQSLILEWGRNSKILLYLSEEDPKQIELKFYEKERHLGYLTPNLHVITEREIKKHIDSNSYRTLLTMLEIKLKASGAQMFVFDNLTTSTFYENKLHNVGPLLEGFKDIAIRLKIPIVFICHTKQGISEQNRNLFSLDDIRGPGTLCNQSDYFYSIMRHKVTSITGSVRFGTFIYVNKCRWHDSQGFMYRLDYDVNFKRYVKDQQVDFNLFKKWVSEKDRA